VIQYIFGSCQSAPAFLLFGETSVKTGYLEIIGDDFAVAPEHVEKFSTF
jgi:hypothetical protein